MFFLGAQQTDNNEGSRTFSIVVTEILRSVFDFVL